MVVSGGAHHKVEDPPPNRVQNQSKFFFRKSFAGSWMIGALCELSIYVLGFCLKLRFKGIVEMGYIVKIDYMYPIQ